MATGYGVPVRFTKEKNVWDLFGLYNIGSGGAINVGSVQANGSPQYINKGIANVWQNTPTFTGATSSGSSTITSVSSFVGLFSGMSIVGAGTTAVLGTITVSTKSIVMSAAALTPAASGNFVASGGQYIVQFGVNQTNGTRLDTYNRLLSFKADYDFISASVAGTVSQQALGPNLDTSFICQNNTTIVTIPSTATSGSTDASVVIQFGFVAENGQFVPRILTAGANVRLGFTFGNTTSP